MAHNYAEEPHGFLDGQKRYHQLYHDQLRQSKHGSNSSSNCGRWQSLEFQE